MQIDYRRPTSKGVTQLMYVGDDGMLEGVLAPTPTWWWVAGAFVAGWFLGKRK